MDFDNLHQILSQLYSDMLPLCDQMTDVARALAAFGALFYIAHRVWQALSRAEPIDVYPLLRPFALGLCIMFFPTFVLGTLNGMLSPIVQGTHKVLENQTLDMEAFQQKKEQLEYEARVREGKAWLVDDEAWDEKMAELGIFDTPEIIGMYVEVAAHQIKQGARELVRDFFELLFNAAALIIDTLRTFFLLVLAILGPIAFAFSIYDGFGSTLTQWLSRYISIYLWLPVSDLFSAVLSRIQVLMLDEDIKQLQDPNFIPDESNSMYIVFLLIGIIGYFAVPTVASWIVQAGGAGAYGRAVNSTASKAGNFAAAATGAAVGNISGRLMNRKKPKDDDDKDDKKDDAKGGASPNGKLLGN